MKAFKVLTPGAWTTVQDLGRIGYQSLGVPISGALDPYACQVANLLVGNTPRAAVLEITVMGPRLQFLAATRIALTGARMAMTLNDDPVDPWQAVRVKPGDELNIHQVSAGCRAYLAVSGGIDVPRVMDSRATYAGGRLGGFNGRPLKSGDLLVHGRPADLTPGRPLPPSYIPDYPEEIVLRAVPGPQDDFFREGLETLFSHAYLVTAKADRMGYRLQGSPVPPRAGMPASIISEPGMPGSIQIPPDQQPIVLFVEQTVGGYTKIATVISADLFRLAQAVPGDRVRFASVDLETAHKAYRRHAARLTEIRALLST